MEKKIIIKSLCAAGLVFAAGLMMMGSLYYEKASFEVKLLASLFFLTAIFIVFRCAPDETRLSEALKRKKTVWLKAPVNLRKNRVITLGEIGGLKKMAYVKKKEILGYKFSETLSYYYVLADGIVYLYEQSADKEPENGKIPKNSAV